MKLDFNGFNALDEKREKDLARVAALLADARAETARKEEEKEHARLLRAVELNRQKRSGKDRHASVVTMFRDKPDGELEAVSIALNEPSELMNALMDMRPVLFTSLVWPGIPMPQREELMRLAGADPELALTGSAFEALPPASKDYCLSWQRVINTGECWQTSLSIGDRGEWMIASGYCMHAIEATEGPMFDGRGRDDYPPGQPGTEAFVRAIMGEEYLAWLVRNEPPGDPVDLG